MSLIERMLIAIAVLSAVWLWNARRKWGKSKFWCVHEFVVVPHKWPSQWKFPVGFEDVVRPRLTDAERAELTRRFEERYCGPRGAGEIKIMPTGFIYKAIT